MQRWAIGNHKSDVAAMLPESFDFFDRSVGLHGQEPLSPSQSDSTHRTICPSQWIRALSSQGIEDIEPIATALSFRARHVSQYSLDVLGDYVGLEVYLVIWPEMREVCDFPGLWNHSDLEIIVG